MIKKFLFAFLVATTATFAQNIENEVKNLSDLTIDKDITSEKAKVDDLNKKIVSQTNALRTAETNETNAQSTLNTRKLTTKQLKSQVKIANQSKKLANAKLKHAIKANGKENVMQESNALAAATTEYNQKRAELKMAESAEKSANNLYKSAKQKAKLENNLLKQLNKQKKEAEKQLKNAEKRVNEIEKHAKKVHGIDKKLAKNEQKITKEQANLAKAAGNEVKEQKINIKIQKLELEKTKLEQEKQEFINKIEILN